MQGQKLPPNGGNVKGFLWTPWSATSRTTAQDVLWQHILDRNTSSQPFMTPCARQVMNRIPRNVTPPYMSRVLRAASLMLDKRSNILTSTEEPTTSKADPPDRGPPPRHRTQATWPLVPCYICPQYGIISTLKIPAVSSGATWTL